MVRFREGFFLSFKCHIVVKKRNVFFAQRKKDRFVFIKMFSLLFLQLTQHPFFECLRSLGLVGVIRNVTPRLFFLQFWINPTWIRFNKWLSPAAVYCSSLSSSTQFLSPSFWNQSCKVFLPKVFWVNEVSTGVPNMLFNCLPPHVANGIVVVRSSISREPFFQPGREPRINTWQVTCWSDV